MSAASQRAQRLEQRLRELRLPSLLAVVSHSISPDLFRIRPSRDD